MPRPRAKAARRTAVGRALPRLDATGLGLVVIVSPHDDDAAIGCGGLIQALPLSPVIVIVTDGRLGYESASAKSTIVATRRREARESYVRLGLPPERLVSLDYPDLSLRNFLCFETLDGRPGVYQSLLRMLREWRVDTLLLPNAADFHPDHKAANEAGLVAAEMARTTLMPDLGPTAALRAVFTYQVWEPLERPTARLTLDTRQSERKLEALSAYASQGTILQELARRKTLSYKEERFTRLAAF